MNMAILLSGGIGSRISTDIPKQYIRVRGRMIVTYALRTLLEAPQIDGVYIVAELQWQQKLLDDAREAGLIPDKVKGFALPGANRQCSVLNGLHKIYEDQNEAALQRGLESTSDSVLIHDAARPMLSRRLLDECYRALEGHDGVMPVLPMKDTVYYSQDGTRVDRLLDRSSIFAGQAPELYRMDLYYKANRSLWPDKILAINGSTEPAIMAGMDIVMIRGEESNYKITTDTDLKRFMEAADTI
ncbi:MAG: 2-C-methyl-D-erythritol 4-phosphate cytidylyltransferase [Lachnospiraceae bacterium]|nr:2-C-methyl-D-erythritol 4-phosphate cytidylyltransferase [Lachnospiraceae bacterium]